jgi:hypothetical protein
MSHRSTRWIVPAILLAALTAAIPARRDAFSLVLERDGNAWRATCDAGCGWTEIGSSRPAIFGTTVAINNYGLEGWLTRHDTTATFEFKVTADGENGWKAKGLKGTAWTDLGFHCANSPCQARITESGVESVR